MARYTYNAGLVTQTIDTLYAACDTLDSTNVDMKKGIDMIYNARGAENINIDFSPITGYQSSVIEYIETMATEIQKKAQEIEEYQDAPWYKKLFATIGMGALKLVEGLASFVEQIGDGLVSIVGFIGGIFSSDFRDCIGEFVKKDLVGDTTAKWYEEGGLQWFNKYSVMSHESTAANILKGVGVAAGYVILSVATAGAGTAVSLGVSAVAAGVGGIGSGTQSGLQAGKTFNQAFGQGVKQGAVAAATTLVVGGIANKLTAGARATTAMNSIDDLSSAANNTKNALSTFKTLANSADEMAGLADDVANLSQYADDVANFADDALVNGGTTIKNANNAFKTANNLAKQAQNLKTAATAAGASDDIINSLDDVIAQANKAADIAKATKTAVAAAQGTNAVTSEGNKITNAIANSKVGQAVTNAGNAIANSKIGTAATQLASRAASSNVGQIVTNLATKAGPTVTNAIAAGAGTVTGGMATAPVADATFKQMYEEATTPTAGQQLYTESQSALEQNIPSSATEQQAQQNLQDRQDQGYTPGSSSPEVTQAPTNVTPAPTATATSPSGPRPTSPSGTKPSISAPEITMPEYTTQPPQQTTAPTPTPSATTYRPSVPQEVIGTISPIVNPTSGPTGPGNPGISNLTDPSTITTGTKDIVSSEVLDTFGNVSGSLSDISGSKTNIPTSSSPILSSDGGSSNSKLVPLGAGLGAASLAGIGAKAYLDKREKSEEDEEDELETEEWASQDDMEIDYGLETDSEEADYLSPTDELAFTE